METFVALLRAVNVGGTGKLAMTDLRSRCEQLGLCEVRTYIQSGNVIFASEHRPDHLKSILEKALQVPVYLRTALEMQQIARDNPFPGASPSQLLIHFLDEPDPSHLEIAGGDQGEQWKVSGGQVYVHFPNGMGRSKLKLPFGTGRNLNTITRLADMALRQKS
jgi:uncharacterized protein (DUF1697 family)